MLCDFFWPFLPFCSLHRNRPQPGSCSELLSSLLSGTRFSALRRLAPYLLSLRFVTVTSPEGPANILLGARSFSSTLSCFLCCVCCHLNYKYCLLVFMSTVSPYQNLSLGRRFSLCTEHPAERMYIVGATQINPRDVATYSRLYSQGVIDLRTEFNPATGLQFFHLITCCQNVCIIIPGSS